VYLVKTKRKQAVGPGPLAATTGLQHFSRMTDGTTRLDTWLWAARFYKTRALAAAAVDGGRVELNDQKPKRGKSLKPGDRVRIHLGPYEHLVTVLGLSQRRGPAAAAALLYEEDAGSRALRERLAEQHRLAAQLAGDPAKGRPTKRDRRELEKLKRRY
jgi:ribosome-associated heat shock protein Hsp15